MRIIFMGTPDFSVPTLEVLVHSRHQVIGVVTQPDKPKGRGREIRMSPVKETALKYGIPVYQPVRAREEGFVQTIRELNPDVMVVIAFGQILSKELLEVPRYGCVNIHASLLPKYRGAAPIQWAVINGDQESGITTMQMDAGMDTGDMLEKMVVKLNEKETGGSLFDRLSLLGGDLILSTLDKIEKGTITRTPQNHADATYVKKIEKSFGDIDWTRPAVEIERLIRGLNPWPSAFTHVDGRLLKIWEADVEPEKEPEADQIPEGMVLQSELDAVLGAGRRRAGAGDCGRILKADADGLLVQTGDGVLRIVSVQLEGKKRMDTAAFLRGFSLEAGMRFERSC